MKVRVRPGFQTFSMDPNDFGNKEAGDIFDVSPAQYEKLQKALERLRGYKVESNILLTEDNKPCQISFEYGGQIYKVGVS